MTTKEVRFVASLALRAPRRRVGSSPLRPTSWPPSPTCPAPSSPIASASTTPPRRSGWPGTGPRAPSRCCWCREAKRRPMVRSRTVCPSLLVMLRVTLRGLLSHKIRFVLTTFAVVVGVGFVVGTLVLTDSVRSQFNQLFTDINSGIDLQVKGADQFDQGAFGQSPPIPDSLIPQIRDAPRREGRRRERRGHPRRGHRRRRQGGRPRQRAAPRRHLGPGLPQPGPHHRRRPGPVHGQRSGARQGRRLEGGQEGGRRRHHPDPEGPRRVPARGHRELRLEQFPGRRHPGRLHPARGPASLRPRRQGPEHRCGGRLGGVGRQGPE